ncbi:alkylated DNA repair protein (DNA oxidative demethylase) [Ciceribacter lividus]|uniref:Alkylated DNA repair protein (DNA oxidative demethylase) n=1 Tax=Ciceribacter lividus TaxID=1197950 RepID=A0A6I7HJX2_9HYPH|nr:alpha-ketoglutarate-dependent dioxygenase AlkB [Ciceribacter lividus]RCW20409.1 alkylated DNA repair protein (DNA oxidative demethylase) [Ciceribacter lividus]
MAINTGPGWSFPDGVKLYPGYLTRDQQKALLEEVREVVAAAPLYVPVMPGTGAPLSVRMTNCGSLGWVTDKVRGYRYQSVHPVTQSVWPPIPDTLIHIWEQVACYPKRPDACLVNFYAGDARMGLHQDKDEQDLEAPVVSVSLGDTCLFRLGGKKRNDRTRSFRLASGDVLVLGGEGRLAFHGVDLVYPGTSTLLKNGGRINLTLRRVSL